jgi:hypothetical protein
MTLIDSWPFHRLRLDTSFNKSASLLRPLESQRMMFRLLVAPCPLPSDIAARPRPTLLLDLEQCCRASVLIKAVLSILARSVDCILVAWASVRNLLRVHLAVRHRLSGRCADSEGTRDGIFGSLGKGVCVCAFHFGEMLATFCFCSSYDPNHTFAVNLQAHP